MYKLFNAIGKDVGRRLKKKKKKRVRMRSGGKIERQSRKKRKRGVRKKNKKKNKKETPQGRGAPWQQKCDFLDAVVWVQLLAERPAAWEVCSVQGFRAARPAVSPTRGTLSFQPPWSTQGCPG